MIGTKITITSTLAEAVGELAKAHVDSSVTIRWDNVRSEEEWEVIFADGPTDTNFYIVNDETGSYTRKVQ